VTSIYLVYIGLNSFFFCSVRAYKKELILSCH